MADRQRRTLVNNPDPRRTAHAPRNPGPSGPARRRGAVEVTGPEPARRLSLTCLSLSVSVSLAVPCLFANPSRLDVYSDNDVLMDRPGALLQHQRHVHSCPWPTWLVFPVCLASPALLGILRISKHVGVTGYQGRSLSRARHKGAEMRPLGGVAT